MKHKDIIQQQRTPPEAGPLAASGCCWVTSEWEEWTATPKSFINQPIVESLQQQKLENYSMQQSLSYHE